MDDENNDWSDFGKIIRVNKRGANDYWYWRNKAEMEVDAARAVLEGSGCNVGQLESRNDDPPDCEAIVDGKRSGIEITELVHERSLKSTIKGSGQYFLWDRDDLLTKLQKLIQHKDRADIKGGPYDRYILVIVTDEFVLERGDVSRFLEGAEFSARHITDCFFGLSYHPATKSCPIFKLKLKI
jgi:hypothetical protein